MCPANVVCLLSRTFKKRLSHQQQKGNSDTCHNMGDPWKHYAKWSKPDTKGQILYASTHMTI